MVHVIDRPGNKCSNARPVNFEFCVLDMTSTDKSGGNPAKKSASVMKNFQKLAVALEH